MTSPSAQGGRRELRAPERERESERKRENQNLKWSKRRRGYFKMIAMFPKGLVSVQGVL